MAGTKLARPIRYFGDKVVDVLMYIVISSVIASVPYLILPALSPGFIFLTVGVGAGVGMILVYLLTPYVDRLVEKRRRGVEGKSTLEETAQKERAITQLMGIARMGYRHELRDSLRMIGKDLDEHMPTRFVLWNGVEPGLKESLITYKPEYAALEDLSNSLDQRSNNFGKPDFDVRDNLCKNHYERLKRLGFVY
jgi:hypothetical protein